MTQLEAFATVMRLGTATAAANVLHTSQPSITRSIKMLEFATGLTLFERNKARLQPTREAQLLFDEVESSFIGLRQVQEKAQNIRSRALGELRVACLPAFSHGVIARTIAKFCDENEKVSISIRPLKSSQLRLAVENQDIDVGIAAYDIEHHALHCTNFTSCNEVLVMAAEHPLASRTAVTVHDLMDARIVRLARDDMYRQRLDELVDEHNVVIRASVETETSASVCALVAQGVGVALVNPLTALDFVNKGLVMRSFDHHMPFVTTLLRRKDAVHSLVSDRFIETLTQQRDQDLERISKLCG